jgi:hypothetical protein
VTRRWFTHLQPEIRWLRLSQPQRAASASDPERSHVTILGEALRVGHPRSDISSQPAYRQRMKKVPPESLPEQWFAFLFGEHRQFGPRRCLTPEGF